MDFFSLGFAATVAGSLGFSAYSAYRAFGGRTLYQSPLLSNRAELEEHKTVNKGIAKMTNVLSVFPDGTIRTRDGGYIKGYRYQPSESFYGNDIDTMRLYDNFALLLTCGLPKDAVIQFRFDNQTDPGNLLNEQSLEITANLNDTDPTAQLLKQEELNYYFELAAAGNFRTGSFSVWVYLPSAKNGVSRSGLTTTLKALAKGDLVAAKESLFSNEKHVVCRYLEEEEKCFETATRQFRNFEQNFPSKPITPYNFSETCVHLRLSHNPTVTSIPQPPSELDTDWQGYLSRTPIKKGNDDWYLWHGSQPVTVITLFEPPESNAENPSCYTGLMRFLTTNPTLHGRCTVIPEYICFDKDESINEIKKDIKRMRQTNTRPSGNVEFKDEKVKRAYHEKKQMLNELTSPGKSLTAMRFQIVVRGRAIKHRDERKEILRELEDEARNIIKLINENMQGAQADFEDSVALREIYEKTLIGEISPKPRRREIKEQASSLVCFIPAESDWKGLPESPHNLYVNTSGELIGINLLRNPHTSAPLTLILGTSGSGKSVLAADLISGFLGQVANARVRACDYGGSLASLVNLLKGRYFRFSEKDRRTINIWDYDGLERNILPDDEQIELVIKDTMILLGADEQTEHGKDFLAVLEKTVRQVYIEEVPRNAPGRRHEPRLSHLILKLRRYPFESIEEKQTGHKIASRLDNYKDNPWVDAPTDDTYRQFSRFDVFELSSLDKLPESLRACLAFRIGAMVGANSEIDGIYPPMMNVYDEVHEYTKNPHLRHTLRGAEKNAAHGRKQNKVPILITHSFDEIAHLTGLRSKIGTIFVGKQDDITSLKELRKWNDRTEQVVMNIENRKGLAHQFLYVTGQGAKQKMTCIQVYLSGISLWTFTTDPPEDQARKIMANALPHWSLEQRLIWLAQNYERGLSAVGKTKIDDDKLQALVEFEQQHNPQYRNYVKQMKRMDQNILDLPDDIEIEDLFEEVEDSVLDEIDRIKHANFESLNEIHPDLKHLGFDMPNAVIVKVQGD